MRNRGDSSAHDAKADCDLCRERKGRNRAIVHILKHSDREQLRNHLLAVYGESYAVNFYLTLWDLAQQIYGNFARQKQMPLWLAYLEAHGVKVNNRAEAIMKFRGHQESRV